MGFRLVMGTAALSLLAACSGSAKNGAAGAGGAAGSAAGAAGVIGDDAGAAGEGGRAGGASGGSGAGAGGQGGAGFSGGNAGSGGSGGVASVADAETAACINYVRAFCAWWSDQCAPESDTDQARRANYDDCIVSAADTCPDVLFSPGSNRTAASVESCAAQWPEHSCEAYIRGQAPACATAGTRAAGERCAYASQCAGYCEHGDANPCPVCAESLPPDAACEPSAVSGQCVDGYSCDPDSATCTQSPESPTPAAAIGEPCELTRPYACDRKTAKCVAGDDGVARCMAWPVLGESCSGILACKPDDSYCDASERCAAWPVAGEPCADTRCAPDHLCDFAVSPAVCVALPSGNEPCEALCAAPFSCVCDDATCATKLCKRLRFIGESCSDPSERCLEGPLRCEGGVCVSAGLQGLFEETCE